MTTVPLGVGDLRSELGVSDRERMRRDSTKFFAVVFGHCVLTLGRS